MALSSGVYLLINSEDFLIKYASKASDCDHTDLLDIGSSIFGNNNLPIFSVVPPNEASLVTVVPAVISLNFWNVNCTEWLSIIFRKPVFSAPILVLFWIVFWKAPRAKPAAAQYANWSSTS